MAVTRLFALCRLLWPVLLFLLVSPHLHAAEEDEDLKNLVQVRLLADVESIAPGKEFTVGIEFTMKPHWHIYWRNPGDSGLPPEIKWQLPEGFKVGEFMWPIPKRIEMAGLTTYGYEDRVILLAKVTPPADLKPGQKQQLAAKLTWLVCKDICLSGNGDVALELPVAKGEAKPNPESAELFTVTWQNLPSTQSDWTVKAQYGFKDNINLWLKPKPGANPPTPREVYFYANQGGVIVPNAKQQWQKQDDGGYRLILKKDPATDNIDLLSGVLVSDTSWVEGQQRSGKWEINPKVSEPAGEGDAPESGTSTASGGTGSAGFMLPTSTGFEGLLLSMGLPGWLLLAFLGGLILNIMPCVLPVLSLKVFSLVKHSEQSQAKAVAHGVAYTAGVVVSFLLLAGILLALRAGGEHVGWAFQLQNPVFVAMLTALFFLFGLNLFGVFEIGASLVGADAAVSGRGDLAGSFGTGVLAAVVGAPCIGPFLGAVTGLAVQLDAWQALLLFAVMGLGLASPFLLLAFYPKARIIIPKPGAWMEAFKQLMGFLLMFAVIFLLWTISELSGADALVTVLVGLVILGMAGWIYGRWSAPHRAAGTRWTARVVALLLLAYGGWMAADAAQNGYERMLLADEAKAGGDLATDQSWQAWSPERVQQALDEGKPVFVDFTATWCLICQANKRGVLQTQPVEEAFQQADVVTMVADYTRRNDNITRELEKFGRSGVPLYLLYDPKKPNDPEILPQTLSQSGVIQAVEKIGE